MVTYQSGLIMQLDQLFELWKVDSEIDRTELGEVSTTIPKLHYKYYKLFSQERLTLRKLEAEYKVLFKDKWEYYQGNMSEEDLNEREWDPFPLKVLKSDIDKYIESDTDIIKHNYKIEYQNTFFVYSIPSQKAFQLQILKEDAYRDIQDY